MTRRRTPQEKKILSYARDRRNTYGQNDKASRKLIPRRKACVNRVFRRTVNEVLRSTKGVTDCEILELVEGTANNLRRPDWKKASDTPLGDVIVRKLARRVEHTANGKTLRKRANDFVSSLKIETSHDGNVWYAVAPGFLEVPAHGATEQAAVDKFKSIAGLLFMERAGGIYDVRIGSNSISYTSR